MKYTKFINRIDELKLLRDLHQKNKPKLLILYGRRRVGKTALLNQFAKRHKALYLVARRESKLDQLKKISSETAEFFNDEVLKTNHFTNYDALFTYLSEKNSPVIFDEFPYLVESEKALPSILQEYWDKKFSKKKSFIILCGSSITMMESLLGYKSPLYGRRTEQMLLQPLKFKDACEFFHGLNIEKKIINYAILGGIPAYLHEFDYEKSVINNIEDKILAKNKFLHQDVQFVIQQELNEPRVYYSLIKSIAKGNNKLGNIVNDAGFEKGTIIRYLSVLQDLQIIERRVPITEKHHDKSRKGLYFIKDNYFKFWFRFVFENVYYIEQDKLEILISDKIKPQLNSFVGEAFEEIVLAWLKSSNKFKNYIFGRWWDKGEEIDVLGLSNSSILIGEVKWKNLTENQAEKILDKLKIKSELIINNKNKKFMLFAKFVKNKTNLKKKGYYIFDLNDLK